MSEIEEGDWVVTRDIPDSTVAFIGNHSDRFCRPEMVITSPVRVSQASPAYKGWFSFTRDNFSFNYHPDWLRKVSQDSTEIRWSWLTELGW